MTEPKSPNIVSLFVIKFDVKLGYEVLWSKSTKDIDLSGIEFKCLPSGVHEFDQDVTLFTHRLDKLYYGISKFRNINDGNDDSRDHVKMYSIGCLCEPEDNEWLPHTFISNGFEYIDYLDDYLLGFLHEEKVSYLDELDVHTIPVNKFTNPINHLFDFFNKFGPLVFKIYKLSLLRKRIIIFNQSKKDNYLLQVFNYIIAILSIIPSNLKVDFQHSTKDFVQPLYNICLHDLENKSLDLDCFIATTNDDILMYQPVYDYAIIVNDELPAPEILSFNDVSTLKKQALKSTYNDYSKFKIIYNQLLNEDSENPMSRNRSVDNLSINTSTSLLSNLKFFSSSPTQQSDISYEPNWWLHDSTYPLSWTQFIWSAFSWFASAGYNSQHGATEAEQAPHLRAPNSVELVEIIGYFHKLTKKWIYIIHDLISDELIDDSIELTYQDLVMLELDPYSKYDTDFISEFIKTYWDIKTVEVSSGLTFFC